MDTWNWEGGGWISATKIWTIFHFSQINWTTDIYFLFSKNIYKRINTLFIYFNLNEYIRSIFGLHLQLQATMRDPTLCYKTHFVVLRSNWEMRNPTLITSPNLLISGPTEMWGIQSSYKTQLVNMHQPNIMSLHSINYI